MVFQLQADRFSLFDDFSKIDKVRTISIFERSSNSEIYEICGGPAVDLNYVTCHSTEGITSFCYFNTRDLI